MSKKRPTEDDKESMEPKRQTLKQLDHREWLLLRPDTHIGEVKPMSLPHLILEPGSGGGDICASIKTVEISPALVRLLIELLMNALDNARRCGTQRFIKVSVDAESGVIHIKNDGSTLPIEPFAATPDKNTVTVAFSVFLVSSNYDDEDDRYGAGKNGVGGKGCNVFASEFEVEVVDPPQHFHQRWENNMTIAHAATIKKVATKTPSTLVRWRPDYERLGMGHVLKDGLSEDEVSVLRGLVYAVSVCAPPKVGVWLDDNKLTLRSTETLVRALGAEGPIATDSILLAHGEQVGDVCFSVSVGARGERSPDGVFLAWVNGTPCNDGTHNKHIMSKVVDALFTRVRAKTKGKDDPLLNVKPAAVKDEMIVVCTLLVRNPRFTSQQKTELASSVKEFGFSWTPTERFQTQLGKSDLVGRAIELGTRNAEKQLVKAMKPRSRDVPAKYEKARKLRSGRAALIITEGDSAQNVATIGVGVIGRNDYGIFPIRGKLLNCLNASKKDLLANKEVSDLISILNLDVSRTYTAADRVDYNHLVILSDQDPDGAHIRGLLIVFIHTLFPSLLEAFPNFIRVFATPLVRSTYTCPLIGKTDQSWFNQHEFHAWCAAREVAGLPLGTIKYYKGLGALSSAFAKTLFQDMDKHLVTLTFTGQSCTESLSQFFEDTKANERKEFLAERYDATRQFNFLLSEASIQTWCEEDVSHFLMYNNTRSLPSAIDGLKTSQRKVLHGCFKLKYVKGRKEDMKVFQMVGAIAAETKYHHGDASLTGTVNKMAAEYPGSNNVALLWGDGQFGSTLRHAAASSRYVSAFLDPIARFLFPAADDGVLDYIESDGKLVEPHFFCPIVPMLLLNGAEGIGSGWSTYTPQFKPIDVVNRVRLHLHTMYPDEDSPPMEVGTPEALCPWYRGFGGTIERDSDGNFTSYGAMTTHGTNAGVTIHISALPIGTKEDASYAEDLKKTLVDKQICSHANDVTQDTDDVWKTHISARTTEGALANVKIEDVLKLKRRLLVSNMHLWDADGKLRRFTVDEVVAAHAVERDRMYTRRLAAQLACALDEFEFAHAKKRYIKLVRDGLIELKVATKVDLLSQIEECGFPKKNGGWSYLTGMPCYAMTDEVYEELERESDDLEVIMERLRQTKVVDVWRLELNELEVALTEYDARAQGSRPDVGAS